MTDLLVSLHSLLLLVFAGAFAVAVVQRDHARSECSYWRQRCRSLDERLISRGAPSLPPAAEKDP